MHKGVHKREFLPLHEFYGSFALTHYICRANSRERLGSILILGRSRFVEEARRNKLEGHKIRIEAHRTGIIKNSLSNKLKPMKSLS